MIFLDANIFLRYLADPRTEQDRRMHAVATLLFDDVEHGRRDVTTSEATLADVAFILTDSKHYGGERSLAGAALRALLLPNAFRLPTKTIVLRALELWSARRTLSFPDSLAAAYSELRDFELATFDKRLRAVPTVRLLDFPDIME